jgi:hypothetical protein
MEQPPADVFLKNQCPYCGHAVEVGGHLVGEMISCPHSACGRIFRIAVPEGEPAEQDAIAKRVESASESEDLSTALPISDETLLLTIHPTFVRRRPLKALTVAAAGIAGLVALAWWGSRPSDVPVANDEFIAAMPQWLPAGLGALLAVGAALVFVFWWIRSWLITVTVTSKRTTYREGVISRAMTEVQHDDVRNLQIEQNLLDRILGIGNIAISSSGEDGMEIHAIGIPGPDRIAEVIRKYQ